MTSVRVYTLLTPGQKSTLVGIAKKQDRSVSYLIARSLESKIDLIADDVCMIARDPATEKVFTRVTPEVAARVKASASRLQCHDWQAVNAAVQYFFPEVIA